MKSYTITVNGTVYEVTVEENDGAQVPASPVKAAPKAAPKAEPKKAAAPAGAKGSVSVVAPMPGKILGIKANAGDAVTKGQVLVVLEAMKMENEIVAPQDGTLVSVDTSVGASVEAGAVLLTMN